MSKPEPFPWEDVMEFGFGVMKLSSQSFWSLSLPELEAAMRCHLPANGNVPRREELLQMMKDCPDQTPLAKGE